MTASRAFERATVSRFRLLTKRRTIKAMDERTRRLIALKDTVKGYFEVTGVGVGGWEAGFDAVRHTDALAESFVTDLRRLIMFIESEFEFGDETRPDVPLPPTKPQAPRPARSPLGGSPGRGASTSPGGTAAKAPAGVPSRQAAPQQASSQQASSQPRAGGSASPHAAASAAASSASASVPQSPRSAGRGVPVPPPRTAPSTRGTQPSTLSQAGSGAAPSAGRHSASPASHRPGGAIGGVGRKSAGAAGVGQAAADDRVLGVRPQASELVEMTARQALEEFTADPTEKVELPEKRSFSPSGRHRKK